jgi:transcriptional regulator with XRE-family HTH domain
LRQETNVVEISRRLRSARELAGLSLEDLAATTRIRREALQAIERGEFDRLPGDFYIRAFLRTYAREVHLPPDEIVGDYEAMRGEAAPEFDAPRTHSDGHRPPAPPAGLPILSRPWTVRAVVGLTVVLLVVTVIRSRPVANRPHEAGAVGTSGVVEAAPAPPVAAPQAEAAPDKLVLEIRPAGPTWVTGAADGKRVLYRLLTPGEHITVEARDDLSFRIGNAVAFAYAINGVPGKPLGGPDEIREFRITRENYRSFRR